MLVPVTPSGPEAQSQFQPLITTSKLDCVPCSTRKAIRRATVDAKAPTTRMVRAKTGVYTRGLTYGEAAEAAEAFGVKLTPLYGNSRAEMFDLIDAGRGALLSIRCAVTVNTRRATGDFRGDHTVYVHDVRHVNVGAMCRCEKVASPRPATSEHNEYLIEDPGNSSIGYVWWSAKLVYEAGEARTRDAQGRTHGINLCVTPDTEGVKWRVVEKGAIRSKPRSDSAKVSTADVGEVFQGGRTETGGQWRRADGTFGRGWVHVEYRPGKWGWVRGRLVRRA
jgi:hypothetical protein